MVSKGKVVVNFGMITSFFSYLCRFDLPISYHDFPILE